MMCTWIKKLSDNLDRASRFLLFVALVAMTLFITAQVIFRVFFTALSWTEELSRYLLVWSSFIGASVAFKKGAHISVGFLTERLPAQAQHVLQYIYMGLMALFFVVSIWYGFLLMKLQIFQISPAMGLKMRYVYTVIPLSFLVMFIHLLDEVCQLWSGKRQPSSETPT